MYVYGNPKTKKELKQWVKDEDKKVRLMAAGPFDDPNASGTVYIEGPQHPEPHKWYAQCRAKDGVIVEVVK